jgi:hypothetical protein
VSEPNVGQTHIPFIRAALSVFASARESQGDINFYSFREASSSLLRPPLQFKYL